MLVSIQIKCPFCGTTSEITVKEEQYNQYKAGALAQVAFPDLDADHREMLISGLCLNCQKEIFG